MATSLLTPHIIPFFLLYQQRMPRIILKKTFKTKGFSVGAEKSFSFHGVCVRYPSSFKPQPPTVEY